MIKMRIILWMTILIAIGCGQKGKIYVFFSQNCISRTKIVILFFPKSAISLFDTLIQSNCPQQQ